jgi:hypothetical protein
MDSITYIYTPYDKCQHFWHFMMGEFMPIISIIVKTQQSRIIIYNETRKWGQAFDIFYRNIENNNLQIYLQNISKNDIETKDINNYKQYDISDMKWDWNWTKQDEIDCMLAVKWLTINTLKYMTSEYNTDHFNSIYKPNNKDIIIQDRRNNLDLSNYFNNENIGTKDYGKEKRSVKDLDKLQTILSINKRIVSLIYTDGKHLYEQIYPYINKNNIILGHGAGMFFTLFMKKKAKVIEIIPPEKIIELNGAAQGLIRISHIKNFKIKRLLLKNHTSILSTCNINSLILYFINN